MVEGEGDDQLCGNGRAIANFGGVDVVSLLGAIAGCHGRVASVVFNFSGKTSIYIRNHSTHCCQVVGEACSFENDQIKTIRVFVFFCAFCCTGSCRPALS